MFPRSGFDSPGSPAVAEKLLMRDGRLGEGSPFHEHHGSYVEGVHKDVVILPRLWENRLVPVRVEDGSAYGRTGYCIDPVDLCVSKAIAGREKDRLFVSTLADSSIVTAAQILERIDRYGIEWPPTYTQDRDLALSRARSWLEHLDSAAAEHTSRSPCAA
ncbi:hypothetical protein ACFYVR_26230 [Rhodococcus sp. NPDC003318]|uniref:hypothetical protein n=1 Tax=Rhodococcus sp. NPDC003318 TaxID=3364503 RepID=UPI003689DF67